MIKGTRPYTAYKPSGVGWLRNVPEHWKIRRLRNVVDMRVSNVDKHVKDGENPVRLCNYVDVYNNDKINKRMDFMHATATNEEIERFRLVRDDVLITKDSETWDDIGVPALVTEPACDLILGYHLALLRPRSDKLAGAYLLRALQSKGLAYQFHVEAKGVTRYGLSHAGITSVWLPLPPVSEQAAIVRYLDHADRRIQRYIQAKQKLLQLLEEQKQAVIHQAVTGQIDVRTGKPYAAYKDSGVEWLGDVPEHWEVRKLGQIGEFSKGNGGNREDEVSAGIPCVRYGDLYTTHKYFILQSRSYVSEQKAVDYTPIRFGDMLFAGSGETTEEIGKAAVNLLHSDAVCGGDVIILRPSRQYVAEFMGYVIDCWPVANQKAVMGRGITVMHIYSSNLKNVTVGLPPLSEQKAIGRYLGDINSALDSAISNGQQEIKLLKEYRTRLIADVVTGKLDVRDSAARLPESDMIADLDVDGTDHDDPGIGVENQRHVRT